MNNFEQNSFEQKENEDSTLIESIHFRCPKCSKLFSTKTDQVHVEFPEFTCSQCHCDFKISFFHALEHREVVGVKINSQKPPESFNLKEKQTEDSKAEVNTVEGLELDKLIKRTKDPKNAIETRVLRPEEKSWQRLLENYENMSLHQKFIKTLRKRRLLDFAIERYAKILEVNPHDETAKYFLNKINIILQTEQQNKLIQRQSRVFSLMVAFSFVLLGLAVIALGHWVFQNKNLIGLGIGIVFFTFAVRAVTQPRLSHL